MIVIPLKLSRILPLVRPIQKETCASNSSETQSDISPSVTSSHKEYVLVVPLKLSQILPLVSPQVIKNHVLVIPLKLSQILPLVRPQVRKNHVLVIPLKLSRILPLVRPCQKESCASNSSETQLDITPSETFGKTFLAL